MGDREGVKISLLGMVGVGFLAAILLAAVGKVGPFGRGRPEAQVKRTLAQVERLVERLEFGSALKYISGSYRDSSGNTFLALRRAAIRARREVKFLVVSVLGGWKVEAGGGRAVARGRVFYYVMTRNGEADRDALDLTIYLRRERGRWKIYRADGLPPF